MTEVFFATKNLNLHATTDSKEAYTGADFIIISTPTNYDHQKNFFDTSSVEDVIELVQKINPDAVMVIKSIFPVRYTQSVREKYHCENIIFYRSFKGGTCPL